MGKAGEKQKRRPKFKDKEQSERFKEAARILGADKNTDALDRIVREIARADQKQRPRKGGA
jgi:hypothetical protein